MPPRPLPPSERATGGSTANVRPIVRPYETCARPISVVAVMMVVIVVVVVMVVLFGATANGGTHEEQVPVLRLQLSACYG